MSPECIYKPNCAFRNLYSYSLLEPWCIYLPYCAFRKLCSYSLLGPRCIYYNNGTLINLYSYSLVGPGCIYQRNCAHLSPKMQIQILGKDLQSSLSPLLLPSKYLKAVVLAYQTFEFLEKMTCFYKSLKLRFCKPKINL